MLLFVVRGEDGAPDVARVDGYRQCAELVIECRVCIAPEDVALPVALNLPMAEGQQDGVELQTFRLVDGQDADARDSRTGYRTHV